MQVTKLQHLLELAKQKEKKRVSVAYAQDHNTIAAIKNAVELGIVDATLVGDKEVITSVCKELECDPAMFEIVHEPDEMKAGTKAVDLVNEGKADLIMKGLISTDKYMRALLNKEKGLMNKGAILSHITVVEVPSYHKLLLASDVAIIPQPDIKQKIAITNYLINAAHRLGIECPKVAVITATEKANPKMEACIDASILSKMNDRNQIKGAKVDGPLALDLAVDMESVKIKKVKSEVAGDADCLVFPSLEAGNVFYKSMTKLLRAELAAVVVGTRKPAILSSRGDSEETKLYSIALGALLS